MAKILVVEDDMPTAALLKELLKGAGHKPVMTDSAETALQKVRDAVPDLAIVDIGLPGISGMQLCDILKKQPKTATLPIILLTSQKKEASKVEGLLGGADDYVTKPFSEQELLARVVALLRRVSHSGVVGRVLACDGIEIDMDRHEARAAGKALELTPKEFDLLALFLNKKGRVLFFSFFADEIWGPDGNMTREDLRFWIHSLRAKLGKAGSRIQSITNQGYRFD